MRRGFCRKCETRHYPLISTTPVFGLRFADIELLLKVLRHLTDQGNSVVVIEHNLDVIKTADWLIDLCPEVPAAERSSLPARRKTCPRIRPAIPGGIWRRCFGARSRR